MNWQRVDFHRGVLIGAIILHDEPRFVLLPSVAGKDTRVIYGGDCVQQPPRLSDAYIDLTVRDIPYEEIAAKLV
jgi:hypothetical protein